MYICLIVFFFLSICIDVVFIFLIKFVLGLKICFFYLVLVFGTFQFMGFRSFYVYILIKNKNFSTKLLIRLGFSILVGNRLIEHKN